MALGTALALAGKAGLANTAVSSAPAILAGLMKHPLWGSIIGSIGDKFLGNILGPELPYGQYAEEQLDAINSMLPDLKTQAAGGETAATRAITEQVRQEGIRAGQSYAQGARRAGLVGGQPGGTTPYRAQQGRVMAATQQGMIQARGQLAADAQRTLAGLSPTAFQHAGISQEADRQGSNDIMAALGRFNREYQQNQFDPLFQEFLELMKEKLFEAGGQPTTIPNPTG
ncbi:MAG: hypothetical protein ACW99G_01710 [Candidatus Thorarchaeota archaeon]|jgi:hypothetical protein